MTKLIVLEVSSDDMTLIGITDKEEVAVEIIKDQAATYTISGDELVKIQHEGNAVFTIRRRPVVVPDEYEYVDNDGNPINSDGSDIVEGEPALVEELPYEYDTTVWIIRSAEEDKAIGISSSEYYLLSEGPHSPFEDNENIVVSVV